MPHLLAFGDSNTHGTPPIRVRGVYERFGADVRWPTRAAAALGPGWTLAEEGLPGRTAQWDDPVMGAHMNGQTGLKIALQSHGPLDVMTLMLGTNDVKMRFGATPDRIMGGIASLLDIALGLEMQARHPGLRVLVICPPPVRETGVLAGEFWGGAEKSRALAPLLAALAAARGQPFLDAGEVIATSPVDGVHFDPAAHAALAVAVAGR
ncbi:GDSL-type esterase/lipase family protein, partial [Aphanothece microscopica]|uniref:GDSL-type esterase/lipase family protein n=1 Tax=Aphanothece microscopica TaxID=1049561 RepID=UPI00398462C1